MRIAIDPANAECLRGFIARRQREQKAFVRRYLHGVPRYWRSLTQGPGGSVSGCAERATGQLRHMANSEFSASEMQDLLKYVNDEFYDFR
jgi:hypothetical protein